MVYTSDEYTLLTLFHYIFYYITFYILKSKHWIITVKSHNIICILISMSLIILFSEQLLK